MIVLGLLAVLAYLLGSLPTGYLIVRWRTGGDLRRVGSGSVGALNAFRASQSVPVAVAVLSVDLAKGVVAVALAGRDASLLAQAVLAAAAVVGHGWPVWLGGRGGKGLATAAGALSVVSPLAVPIWAVVWAGAYVVSGYIALGIVVATAVLPLGVGALVGWPYAAAMLPTCVLIVLRHLGKMARIRRGIEPRHYWRARA